MSPRPSNDRSHIPSRCQVVPRWRHYHDMKATIFLSFSSSAQAVTVPPAAVPPKAAVNSRSFGSEFFIPERASFAQRLIDFVALAFLAFLASMFALAGAACVGVFILLFS
jgi:hypothetical protein